MDGVFVWIFSFDEKFFLMSFLRTFLITVSILQMTQLMKM